MKKFLKILIGLVIFGAILFGVYKLLPEHPQSIVKSIVQPVFDSRAKTLIQEVQGIKNKDLNDMTYKEILEKNNGMTAWVYEKEEGNTVEHVIFYGKGAGVNLKDYPDYNGLMSTSAQVKIDFQVSGTSVDIIPYIDGKIMYKSDAKYKDENEKLRKDLMSQLANGIRAD